MTQEFTDISDAQLAIVDIVTETLQWVFLDEEEPDSPEAQERMSDMRNLADFIVGDLGLTVTAIGEDGTLHLEMAPAQPEDEVDGSEDDA